MILMLLSFAQWIDLGTKRETNLQYRIIQDRAESKEIQFTIRGFYLDTIQIDNRKYLNLRIPGAVNHLKKGYPSLPQIAKSVIIADDRKMNLRIIDKDVERMKVSPIAPSKGNLSRNVYPSRVPYTFSDFYSSVGIFPEKIVTLSDPFIMRDFRGVTVYFNPLRYDAGKGELEIVKRLVVELYSDGIDRINVKENLTHFISKDFENLYQDFFINYREGRYDTLNEQVGRMIIICNDAYLTDMDSLVEWKRKKGIPTDLYPLSAIGNNETDIKNFIQKQYDSLGVTFCLLVGDGNELTPGKGTVGDASGADADPVYAYTAGEDHYPDLFISRFSSDGGSAINIRNQVMRSIKYERNPKEEDWYHMGLGIASNDESPPDYERMNWLRDTLLSTVQPFFTYTSIDSNYEPWGSSSNTASIINKGVSIINYIGHGTVGSWASAGGFSISDINSLGNYWKLPNVISVACLVGHFNGNNCFCESSVDAGTPDNPIGFLTNWGSTIDQTWVPPCVGQEGAVNLLAHYKANTAGGIYFNGASYMIEQYGGSDSIPGVEMAQTWHIFGDASVQLRTDIPITFDVNHPNIVHPGYSNFTVTVYDNDNLTPVKDALVSCYLPENSLLESGYTNASGEVTLPLDLPGSSLDSYISLTFTGFNYKPYMDSVLIRKWGIISPKTVEVGTPTAVTISVDSGYVDKGYPGVEIHIYGCGFEGYDTTDAKGEAVINVNALYGENLLVVGRDIGESYNLFADTLPVLGAGDMTAPKIEAYSDTIGVVGSLMPEIPGIVLGTTGGETDFTLYLDGCGINTSQYTSTSSMEIEVIPTSPGNLLGRIGKIGYNIYQQEIPVKIYRGKLAGYVISGTDSIGNVRILGYKAGTDTSFYNPLFNLISKNDGFYELTDSILCGDYDLYINSQDYQSRRVAITLKYCENQYNIKISPAFCSMSTEGITRDDQLRIRYSLSEQMNISFSVYDIAGRKIEQKTEITPPGWYTKRIDIRGRPSGVYFIRMKAGDKEFNKKVVVIH